MSLMPDGWQSDLLPRLTELYQDLHRHPELSFQEHRTAAKAADLLTEAGYEVTTGVGGTTLTVTSSNAWSRETAWSGGGGGASDVFPIPSRQTPVQKSQGGGDRQVPDVSALANPSPGVSIHSQGSWGQVGGTSAAAPEWAGFAALYNQQASAAGKSVLGFANPVLYAADGTGFHDITSGSNGAYSAAAGWDFATGWGSYNAATLAAKLLGQ
jgi:kumamolisin